MGRRTAIGLMTGALFITIAASSRLPAIPKARPASASKTSLTTTSAPPKQCIERASVAAWPLARQSAQILMIAVQMDAPERARSFLADHGIGGILVRGVTPTLAADLAMLRSASDPPPILAADEEGGRAQRLRSVLGVIPSARVMAATLTARQVEALALAHGKKMRELGITMNLAPVVDLTDGDDPSIGSRSFSADPAVTIRYATAFARGMIAAGVFPVLKHFPGHGHAIGDSHKLQPDTPPIDFLRRYDLLPFVEIPRHLDVGIMAGHLRVPGTDDLPASVSSTLLTGVLRSELGFNGLIVTDALSMLPIRVRYEVGEAAVVALKAGADLLLFDEELDVTPIIQALADAAATDPIVANRLLDATMRVLAVKGIHECNQPESARR